MIKPRMAWLWVVDVLVVAMGPVLSFRFAFGDVSSRAWLWVFGCTLIFLASLQALSVLGVRAIRPGRLVTLASVSAGVTLGVWGGCASLLPGLGSSPSAVEASVLFSWLLLCFWRVLGYLVLPSVAQGLRVGIVASHPQLAHVLGKLRTEKGSRWVLAWTETPDQILLKQQQVDLQQIDQLIIGPSVCIEAKNRLVWSAIQQSVHVRLVPNVADIMLTSATLSQIDDLPVLELQPLALSNGQRFLKRCFDIALTVLILPVAAPLMGTIWLILKVSSPGSAIFRQERVGYRGKAFTIYKFRTMIPDAESETGPVLTTAEDERIIPMGRFLRRTRLDELPQLWNILRNDMSLVGPRPERPFFVNQLTAEEPSYMFRHLAPPGITGLAQVLGKYVTTPWDKLGFDLFYVRHYSMWLDLKILFLTLRAIIGKASAEGVTAPGTTLVSSPKAMSNN